MQPILRAEDLYPREPNTTAYAIEAVRDFNPRTLIGQTVTLNGSRVIVRDVIATLGGINAEGQSFSVIADRV
jgi:hypothetical protein